jgi:hypothetical protein
MTGPLPKGVSASASLKITLNVKCTACGQTHDYTEEIAGSSFNAAFAIQHKMKFTTIKADRDHRSINGAEFLLCVDCNSKVQAFMGGTAGIGTGE